MQLGSSILDVVAVAIAVVAAERGRDGLHSLKSGNLQEARAQRRRHRKPHRSSRGALGCPHWCLHSLVPLHRRPDQRPRTTCWHWYVQSRVAGGGATRQPERCALHADRVLMCAAGLGARGVDVALWGRGKVRRETSMARGRTWHSAIP